MQAVIWQQALTLLLFTSLGAVLAVTYCAFTPFRRAAGRLGGAFLDLLFSMLSGAAIFLLSMYAPGSVQAGIWEFALTAVSFCIFMLSLGEYFSAFFQILCDYANFFCIIIKNFLKKSANFTKFFFSNRQ